MQYKLVGAIALFSFTFGLLLPVFRPIGDLGVSVLSGLAVCGAIGLLWLSNGHHEKTTSEPADMKPIFLRKVPAVRPAPEQAQPDNELERKRREWKRQQQVTQLCRDMVEYNAKGFSRARWAGRRSPSGVYVSQTMWRDAMGVLARCGAVSRTGPGGTAQLVMSSEDTLGYMGLCTLEEQEQTGAIVRRHDLGNTKELVRVG